ncbi:MAG: trypsin-like peptidase domain-containing protein [Candidatus Bathyarchaeia archaeon]|nr:trypsin-like peptidase domain-containing protein [Candidatus Bathyarchaeota archaeon]
MEVFALEENRNNKRMILLLVILLLVVGFSAAGYLGYSIGYMTAVDEIKRLEEKVESLSENVITLQNTLEAMAQNAAQQNILIENISLSEIYERVKNSIVMVRGLVRIPNIFGYSYSWVQGSGFIYNYTKRMIIVTNYHVVRNTVNVTVTFANGNSYPASILGYDPYADLAVLDADAPESEYYPLKVVSSSMLKVGDIVIAVGNPYGLHGSMSVGIVSALGRTITVETAGNYPIANVIQTTVPLNPGNSGGPLLNARGEVVGITTAIVSGSQGVSFAIPSNTLLREIKWLVEEGRYDRHPWLGAAGLDMTYEIAKAMGVNVTYGWLITEVFKGGPADKAGLRGGTRTVRIAGELIPIGGDIIIAVDGFRITGIDDLSYYLEEYTEPGQIIRVTVIREKQLLVLEVELGTRPRLLE